MLSMKFLLLLLLTIPAFAQPDLPERGTVADLKGKTKAYIIADGEHYTALKKVLAKTFTLSDKPAEAEMFFTYKTLSRDEVGATRMFLEHGQLDVSFYRDKTKVIAWSYHLYSGGFNGDTAKDLANRFVKEWNKVTKPPR